MSIRRVWILAFGFAVGIAAISGCKSTGTAFNPPGGASGVGGGSKQQIVVWDEFAANPQPQAEYASLPLSGSSTVTDISGTATNNLNHSFNMLTDATGRLWILSYPSGSPSQTAEIFTSLTSAPITLTFTGTSDFGGGIAFDKSGNLWAVDYTTGNLYEYKGPFTSSGSVSPAVTITGAMVRSEGLAVDAAGNVYVSNSGSAGGVLCRASHIAVYTQPVTSSSAPAYCLGPFAGGLAGPIALIFDSQGNLYAGGYEGSGDYGIARFNSNNLSSGAVPNVVDNTGISAVDSHWFPAQFALDKSGNLFVADCGNAGAIIVYPTVATSFSATEAPSAVYQDTALRSTNCAWGIAVAAASLKI